MMKDIFSLVTSNCPAVFRLFTQRICDVPPGDWWSSLLPSTMVRHVKVWRRALSEILSRHSGPLSCEVQTLLRVLQQMHQVSVTSLFKTPEVLL